MRPILFACAAVSLTAAASAADFPPLTRTPFLDRTLPATSVHHVKGATIHFAPGQPTPIHRHPAAVIGHVAEGSFIFQIEGQPARTLKTGDGFYEPAGATIRRFDNASRTAPATIDAFYLLDRADRPLIEILGK